MKLVIQIPCYNEAETLPITLEQLPREVPGFDDVEWLVVDDGSEDNTAQIAREHGVDHVVRHATNRGLARAFQTGIQAAVDNGADVIVNTDGDNQYNADDIPHLVEPIIQGRADMVIGDRQIDTIDHFSWLKKKLQKLGSWVVRQASATEVPDTTSGFRAFSREVALKMNVMSDFTYTLETLIQVGREGMSVTHVPVNTNQKLRESRLFDSITGYISKSVQTISRIYTTYQPFGVFLSIGAVLFLCGFTIGARFLYFFFTGDGSGHVQSLLLAVLLMTVGFQTGLTGLLADVISNNRKLLEEVLFRLRRDQLGDS